MSAKLKPWICIHSDRTSRARGAGTSMTTLDVVPLSPTISIGSTTVVPAASALAQPDAKTATARLAARANDARRSRPLSGIGISATVSADQYIANQAEYLTANSFRRHR